MIILCINELKYDNNNEQQIFKMGTSASQPFSEQLTGYKIIQKNPENNVTYLSHMQTDREYLLRQNTYNDESLYLKNMNEHKLRQGIRDDHLTHLVRVQGKEIDHLCSNLYKIYAIWEYPYRFLSDQIHQRMYQNRKFQDKQLWSILASSILALSAMQKNKIKHEMLTTKNMLIDSDGIMKIADPLACGSTTNIDAVYRNRNSQNVYISPEQCESLESRASYNNPYKSDVWIMGIILLECGLLQPMGKCYKDEYQRIDYELIDTKLEQFGNEYGQYLKAIVQLMLKRDNRDRPDWLHLQQYARKANSNTKAFTNEHSEDKSNLSPQQNSNSKNDSSSMFNMAYPNSLTKPDAQIIGDKYINANNYNDVKTNTANFNINPNQNTGKVGNFTTNTGNIASNNPYISNPNTPKFHSINASYQNNLNGNYNVAFPVSKFGQPSFNSPPVPIHPVPNNSFQQLYNKPLPSSISSIPPALVVNPTAGFRAGSAYVPPSQNVYTPSSLSPISNNTANSSYSLGLGLQPIMRPTQLSNISLGSLGIGNKPNLFPNPTSYNPSPKQISSFSITNNQALNKFSTTTTTTTQNYYGSKLNSAGTTNNLQAITSNTSSGALPGLNSKSYQTWKSNIPEASKNTNFTKFQPIKADYIKVENAKVDSKIDQILKGTGSSFAGIGAGTSKLYSNPQTGSSTSTSYFGGSGSLSKPFTSNAPLPSFNNITFNDPNSSLFTSPQLLSYIGVSSGSKNFTLSGNSTINTKQPINSLGLNEPAFISNIKPIGGQIIQSVPQGQPVSLNQNIQSIGDNILTVQSNPKASNSPDKQQSVANYGYQGQKQFKRPLQKKERASPQREQQQYNENSIQNAMPQNNDHSMQIQNGEQNQSMNQNLNNAQQPQYVIEEFKQGSRYEGYKLHQMRHGEGKFYYQDGGMYNGTWNMNKMDGFGSLYYQSGGLAYEGMWKDDQFQGLGKLYNQYPYILEGEFNYQNFDEIDQFWTYYQGQFVEDFKKGKGKLMLSNGQYFQGTFNNDMVQGPGSFYCLNGNVIRGTWTQNHLISN